jgi:hypothetical protein
VLTYGLLKEAVLSKKQVTATYDGHLREFCPHALGWKKGEAYCLAYQFGGHSSTGPVVPGSPHNWRCFVVSRLSDVRLREGDWHSCATRGAPSQCFDHIELEVMPC